MLRKKAHHAPGPSLSAASKHAQRRVGEFSGKKEYHCGEKPRNTEGQKARERGGGNTWAREQQHLMPSDHVAGKTHSTAVVSARRLTTSATVGPLAKERPQC